MRASRKINFLDELQQLSSFYCDKTSGSTPADAAASCKKPKKKSFFLSLMERKNKKSGSGMDCAFTYSVKADKLKRANRDNQLITDFF